MHTLLCVFMPAKEKKASFFKDILVFGVLFISGLFMFLIFGRRVLKDCFIIEKTLIV